jgi:hypothetical protein
MSKYYPTYSQYLGSQKCCDFRGQGPPGPQGPPGQSAIGQRGERGPTGDTGMTGNTGPTGSFPELGEGFLGHTVIYDASTNSLSYNTSKSFVIDHPTDSNKYLVHTCLEGPEAGVYYRGTGKILNSQSVKIKLPHYVSTLAYDFTINITPIYDGKIHILNAGMVDNNTFTVYGDNCEFFWTVFGKRFDINIEPVKTSVDVKGNGPYLYI